MPWRALGARAEAEAWIRECCNGLGLGVCSEIEEVKDWYHGLVLRLRTDAGWLYFKWVTPVYAREVEITSEIAAWRSELVPGLVAACRERKWMLTREVAGPTLEESGEIEQWEEAIRAYARLQVDSLGFIEQNSGSSLYDARIETVAAGMEWMMPEIERLQTGYEDPLRSDEIAALERTLPRVNEISAEIASYGVPCALEHNDLHPGNVRTTPHGPIFLDWAWSSVTHPFLSMCLLLHPKRMPGVLIPSVERLWRVYLEEWGMFEPMDRLQEIMRLASNWKIAQYASGDAQWLEIFWRALGEPPQPGSYLAWAFSQRQYYLIKTLRRLVDFALHGCP